ncbi:MAG: sigma 54-interacting transcriptional regulator [Bryobacteraceae bacterium]
MPARILIVEDERITAEDLRDILTDLGYDVAAVVSTGADAIAEAERTLPDLALMDIRIKGDMDGTETAKVLRQRFNVPVVYLTAHADRQTLDRAKLAEPLGYLVKPFQESELQASIEIALHKQGVDRTSRERAELLAATVRAIGEGIISVDRGGAVTLLNPSAEAWTGWNRQAALGTPVGEVFALIHSAGGAPLETPLRAVLAGDGMEGLPDEVILISRNGERRPVGGSIAPIRDHHGAVSGAVIVFGAAGDTHGSKSGGTPGSDDTAERPRSSGFTMVANSESMKQVVSFARRVAESEATTILLEGESGTGKDVLAQYMHRFGKRQQGPFVALNCAAIPETLLESELFGYEKGAFTDARAQKKGILEIASGGTIFLDEIGEMPLLIQAKMLRVLEEQSFRRLGGTRDVQVDLRIVAATNRKLADAINAGKFRLDLFYRLNVIQLLLPPLRDRQEDILPLAQLFISLFNPKFQRHIRGLSQSAVIALHSHSWPGNIRELRNKIERAMVLEETDWIEASTLLLDVHGATSGAGIQHNLSLDDAPPDVSLEESERRVLIKALEKTSWNQSRAALVLQISRDTLRYRMKKHNLQAHPAASPENSAWKN